ncbi:hypothetical protein ACFQL1_14120 [Halomicroarcula sp. GCM10025709]
MTGQATTVSATAVECVRAAITETCGGFEQRTRLLLERNGLPEPERGEWYPLANVRALYEDLHSTTGRNIVEQIGVTFPRVTDWPGGVDGVGAALAGLDGVHRDLHRGEAGGYSFTRTGERTGRLVCDTPYPAAFERGVVRGIGKRFGVDTGFVAIDDHTRSDGATVCTVEWWGERGTSATARLGTSSDTEFVTGD